MQSCHSHRSASFAYRYSFLSGAGGIIGVLTELHDIDHDAVFRRFRFHRAIQPDIHGLPLTPFDVRHNRCVLMDFVRRKRPPPPSQRGVLTSSSVMGYQRLSKTHSRSTSENTLVYEAVVQITTYFCRKMEVYPAWIYNKEKDVPVQ